MQVTENVIDIPNRAKQIPFKTLYETNAKKGK